MADAVGRLPRIAARDCRAWVRRALRRRRRRRRLRADLPVRRGAAPRAERSSALCLIGPSASWTAARSSSAIASATSRADEGREHGFFSEDTRFMSRWVLRVDETPLELLGLDQSAHFAAQFFLDTRGRGPTTRRRARSCASGSSTTCGWRRSPSTNHRHDTQRSARDDGGRRRLRRPVRGQGRTRGGARRSPSTTTTARLTLAYRHGDFRRSVAIAASSPGEPSRATASRTRCELAPGEQWSVDLHRHAARRAGRGDVRAARARGRALDGAEPKRRPSSTRGWPGSAAGRPATPALARTYRASLSDLGALRCTPTWPRARLCPQRDCRGSWRCSAATA